MYTYINNVYLLCTKVFHRKFSYSSLLQGSAGWGPGLCWSYESESSGIVHKRILLPRESVFMSEETKMCLSSINVCHHTYDVKSELYRTFRKVYLSSQVDGVSEWPTVPYWGNGSRGTVCCSDDGHNRLTRCRSRIRVKKHIDLFL